MNRYINILISLLLCVQTFALPTSYKEAEKQLSYWAEDVVKSRRAATKNDKFKEVAFKKQGYVWKGYLQDGKPSVGTLGGIYNLDNTSIVEGLIIANSADVLTIKGLYFKPKKDTTICLYGTYDITNTTNEFTLKTNKANALQIVPKSVDFYEGFYSDYKYPAIVKVQEPAFVAFKGTENLLFLCASIPADQNYEDVSSLIFETDRNAYIVAKDSMIFSGKMEDRQRLDDGRIQFSYGTGMLSNFPNSSYDYLKLIEKADSVFLIVGVKPSSKYNLNKITLYMQKAADEPITKYWNLNYSYQQCNYAFIEYRDGNSFSGRVSYSKDVMTAEVPVPLKLRKGLFKYANGDYFMGDCSAEQIGVIFLDGKTVFNDKTTSSENWLLNYKISPEQLEQITLAQNPTQARQMALDFEKENSQLAFKEKFIDYKCLSFSSPRYFSPIKEYAATLTGMYMTYDVAKKQYIWHATNFCSELANDKNIQLVFALNPDGSRKWEIVYEYDAHIEKYIPEFINEYTWYSNGQIQCIKSYTYHGKQKVLVCNFHSDGVIRSAYKYAIGNNGKYILRMSKEILPSMDGYSCKLNDLDGNFERTVNWKIGEDISPGFFGLGSSVRPMAPELFDLSTDYEEVDRFHCH